MTTSPAPVPDPPDPPVTIAPETTATSGAGTRERILDVALEHFSRQGYAATSLREIAEELGISKAALYYHFESKEDILLALHLRLHNLTAEIVPLLDGVPGPGTWERLVEALIGVAIRNRRLIALHLREQQALGPLHRPEMIGRHSAGDQGAEARLVAVLNEPDAPTEVRVRRVASLGAVAAVLLGAQELADVADDELERILRKVALEVLRPPAA